MSLSSSPESISPSNGRRVHRRRHRLWYKRWWRALIPSSGKTRLYMLIALVVVVTLSILIGVFVARSNSSSSRPADSGMNIQVPAKYQTIVHGVTENI